MDSIGVLMTSRRRSYAFRSCNYWSLDLWSLLNHMMLLGRFLGSVVWLVYVSVLLVFPSHVQRGTCTSDLSFHTCPISQSFPSTSLAYDLTRRRLLVGDAATLWRVFTRLMFAIHNYDRWWILPHAHRHLCVSHLFLHTTCTYGDDTRLRTSFSHCL